jgi:enoyl-CoA hydratase
MTKRGMWLGLDASSLRAAMEMENRTQVLGLMTGNMRAGVEAAMTKTDPDWDPM